MGSALIDSARDADEDVTFKFLTHLALGIITRQELFYKLAQLILDAEQTDIEFTIDHATTVEMARAFDAYRDSLVEAVMNQSTWQAAAVALTGMHFGEDVSA